MKNIFLFLLCAATFISASAKDDDYSIAHIPAELIKNVNAVCRLDETRFELTGPSRARLYRHKVFTILNENADFLADMVVGYDKLHEIRSFEGRLFDAYGKKIKSVKSSDVKDLSGTDDNSLADGNRIKQHNFYYKVYPYTVEYEIEVLQHETMFFPRWTPVRTSYSVQLSSFVVEAPKDYKLRYKAFNYNIEPVITENKNNKEYRWEIKAKEPLKYEYASPRFFDIAPIVLLGPSSFEIEGYKGIMSDWKEFGKFVYALKAGRDELPDNIKQEVHKLTDGIKDNAEKIRVLYNYLQSNTRYISIQLGIGGWQPFDSKYVAANKYGDCKALSNFMFSLLKEAGITSYYTLVNSGDDDDDIITDFPSQQFNHVILCVPQGKDTTWLECTSQTTPAGYMGAGAGNKHALLVSEEGGTIVRTPRYKGNENLQIRNITAEVNTEGHITATVKTRYQAVQQDRLHGLINAVSKDKVMEYLKSEIDLPNYDVLKYDYKEEKAKIPSLWETLHLIGNDYANISGKRLFIAPNVLTKTQRKLVAAEKRTYDVVVDFEYKDIDTVEIKFPPGYVVESMPQDVNIESKFGKYSSSVKVLADKIVYYRSIEQVSGRFPAKDYNELAKYYDQLYKADRNRVVLVRKEQ